MSRNGRVAELGEPVGVPRRLRPVLADLVELVGWRTDADARARARRAGPRRPRPRGARRPRGRGRRRAPCPPPPPCVCAAASCRAISHWSQQWKVEPVGVGVDVRRHRGRLGGVELRRPVGAGRAVLLGQRAPGREPLEPVALRGSPRPRTPVAASVASKSSCERRALGLPGRVAVEGVLAVEQPGGDRRSCRPGHGPRPARRRTRRCPRRAGRQGSRSAASSGGTATARSARPARPRAAG